MSILLKNGNVYKDGHFENVDVFVDDEGLLNFETKVNENTIVFDATGLLVCPGLIDMHVHLRQPGFEYKETIASGCGAAAKGGYTTICAMPNLKPVPDSLENLQVQLELIQKDANVHVLPYASITKGQTGRSEVVDIETLSAYVKGFSDDGKGVQNEKTMLEAMQKAQKVNGLIVAHCEDESELVAGACMHDGQRAQELGLIGINSASEYKQVERDCKLALQTGCRYHVCHVSTIESVEAIRQAQKQGAKVSGEVTVHHLLLNEDDILIDDGKYKMNPPLRSKQDQEALLKGLLDGTLKVIATDHAPHSEEEKSRGLAKSSMGITGIELAFGLIYTNLVKTGKVKLETILDCMSYNPAQILQIPAGKLQEKQLANIAVFDLNEHVCITKEMLVSKGKSTPFEGYEMYGICKLTICDGKIVYQKEAL